ncbi:MAG TPA: hypothetical protein VMD51_15550 [Mycobacterium sp.]|nr:hypothetical protein [Mycobacterium sp.]
MRMFCAAVLLAVGAATAPVVVAPAHADVCGNVGGPHLDVNGCTEIGHDVEIGADVLGAVVVADAADTAAQAAAGRPPCYTRDGVPYYTPGDDPCF